MLFSTEEDLKAVPGLRWKLDDDRSVIATTVREWFPKDHLYFHGPGKLAVYYEAPTRRRATARRKWWIGKFPTGRLVDERRGDLDGILVFRVDEAKEIPREFLLGKRRGRPFGITPLSVGAPAQGALGEGQPD